MTVSALEVEPLNLADKDSQSTSKPGTPQNYASCFRPSIVTVIPRVYSSN